MMRDSCPADDRWCQGEHGVRSVRRILQDTLTGKTLTADSGYHSKRNIQKCEDEKLDAYIPDKWMTHEGSRDMVNGGGKVA